jgi:hypothetical protein
MCKHDERGALAVRDIPLHLQRRFEQRWAAKYASPVAAAAPKGIGLKGTANRLPHRAEAKEKPTALTAPAEA